MKISTETVHRIVATGFLGEAPSRSHVVDHIDTNRRNNRPENLRWVTRLENLLLNPITTRRIVDVYGSIEAFLTNPARSAKSPLGPDFEWMRTVTAEEGQASLQRMLAWARREENMQSKSLADWVERRASPLNRRGIHVEEHPMTKASLTAGASQRRWKTPAEFPACPALAKPRDLETYASALERGRVFSRSAYNQTTVDAVAWTPDRNGLLVLGELPDGEIKPWALAMITLEDGIFVHENCGSFFMKDGADKAFTLAQGLEWTGGEVFDDFC